jgi:hypothetical protein
MSTIDTYHDTEQNDTNSFNLRASTAFKPRRPTASNTRAFSASPSNGKLSTQNSLAPYSISDKFLTSVEIFIEILNQCPEILVLFNKQLSERMIQCYGIDQRLEKKVIEKPPIIEDVDKDYSWILEGKPNKYKSDILQQYVLKN